MTDLRLVRAWSITLVGIFNGVVLWAAGWGPAIFALLACVCTLTFCVAHELLSHNGWSST